MGELGHLADEEPCFETSTGTDVMTKAYEKPILIKREALSEITAFDSCAVSRVYLCKG